MDTINMIPLSDYQQQFEAILSGEMRDYPYDSEEYLQYVKLNQSRIRRWRIGGGRART